MREMISFDKPTRVICHFIQDEERSAMSGMRLINIQVLIDCSKKNLSPSGEFIRLTHSKECEHHGWVRIEDLVIDEILETADEIECTDWQNAEFTKAA